MPNSFVEDRREQVRALSEQGMSVRAIADELGVHYATISRDRRLLGLRGGTIVGLDGKSKHYIFAPPEQSRRRRGRTEEHLLYRFFDAEGVLLYVGLTYDLVQRFSQHSVERWWWGQWATVTATRYVSRAELEAAERKAIKSEKPLYNEVHNKTLRIRTF
jgi:hypothetical protein